MHGIGRIIWGFTPVSEGTFVEQGAFKAAACFPCKIPIYSPFVPFPEMVTFPAHAVSVEFDATILRVGTDDAFACTMTVIKDESTDLLRATNFVACSCL